jgi:triosephosphate isomerase
MLIAGNWKMNTDLNQALSLARGVVDRVGDQDEVDVAVCPPFVNLVGVGNLVTGTSVQLGAQAMHHEEYGAYTGAVSAPMLTSVNCSYVILGHSERRSYFGETDAFVKKAVARARKYELVPIVCVGESIDERNDGRAREVVGRQVTEALDGIAFERSDAFVIAYEPIWAIGTGETATPEQAQEMHAAIRNWLPDITGLSDVSATEILYGGSMKPHNAEALLKQPDIDGGLVGGASLKSKDFASIVAVARKLVTR